MGVAKFSNPIIEFHFLRYFFFVRLPQLITTDHLITYFSRFFLRGPGRNHLSVLLTKPAGTFWLVIYLAESVARHFIQFRILRVNFYHWRSTDWLLKLLGIVIFCPYFNMQGKSCTQRLFLRLLANSWKEFKKSLFGEPSVFFLFLSCKNFVIPNEGIKIHAKKLPHQRKEKAKASKSEKRGHSVFSMVLKSLVRPIFLVK